jgi:hypothetical protein
MSAARPPPAREAATPGLPSMSDSGFNKLFTDTPGSVQSGRLYDAQHTQGKGWIPLTVRHVSFLLSKRCPPKHTGVGVL